jgi:hypothetical protein
MNLLFQMLFARTIKTYYIQISDDLIVRVLLSSYLAVSINILIFGFHVHSEFYFI